MNQAEIMTLLSNGVKRPKIRIAIMAGKLAGILNAADRQIGHAESFKADANWVEILTLLEGTLDEVTDYQADDDWKGKKLSGKPARSQQDRDRGTQP